MEQRTSESTWFLTLTYNDENLPHDHDTYTPVLNRRDVRLYLARLRAVRGGGLKFRYYLCGEYGDRTLRPHYHAILFFSPSNPAPADLETTLDRHWGKGHTLLAEANAKTMAYVASYTLKKYGKEERGLSGRVPEFVTMSTNPALGTEYINTLAEKYLSTPSLQQHLEETEDVTNVFRTEGAIYPIDRYMRDKLRRAVGVPTTRAERREHLTSEEIHERIAYDHETQKATPIQLARAKAYASKIQRRLRVGRPNAKI